MTSICVFEPLLKATWATFRSEYEYKVEFEYDFLNLMIMLSIITFRANLVLIGSYSTGQQQGRARAMVT